MKVIISATLRYFFGHTVEEEIQGNTINEVLANLIRKYPEAKKGLYDESGQLREFIRIFLNDSDVTEEAERLKTRIPEGATLQLLPLIAGGAPEDSLISEERRKAVNFDDRDIERFNKHLLLREIGVKGQKRIRAAKVVVVGAGALGSAVIQYLAAAGVGTIKIIDFDEVSVGNLQSQVIHSLRDVKRPKAASAKDTVRNIDRNIEVIAENKKLDAENAEELIEGFDLVIDCTDNYPARYILNDACILNGIPVVYGAIYQFEGIVTVFGYRDGPCLRCVFPAPPSPGLVPTCAEGGTISPLAGIVGSLQTSEALKLIMGIGEHLSGRLLTVDTLGLHSGIRKIHHNCSCPLCGDNPVISEVSDFDYEELCGLKENDEETPIEGLTPEELANRIENQDPMTIIDVREPHERALQHFPGAIPIPIGQLARRKKELNPDVDTIIICREGKRSILAINTLREAGYQGPLYNLKGGVNAMKDIVFSIESGRL